MDNLLFLAAICLAVSGAVGQGTAPCDPSSVALGFISLANPLGYLACKAGPKVDVTAILANLTTSFKQTSIEEATKLNALLGAMMGAPVENLRPLLNLTAKQMDAVLPVLTKVPTPVVAGTFKIGSVEAETMEKQLLMLRKFPTRAAMEAMIPVFNGLPQAALDIMAIALNKLPAQVFQKVTALVTATGGVGDVMAAKVAPVPSIRKEAADMQLDTQGEADTYFKARDAKCPNKTACKEDEASAKGTELGTSLSSSPVLSQVVCRLGGPALVPVFNQTITSMLGLCPDAIATVADLAGIMATLESPVFKKFAKIPLPVMRQLVAVLAPLDPAASSGVPVMASIPPQETENLVIFLSKVKWDQLKRLVAFLQKLSLGQVDTLSDMLAALSPGQIAVAVRLLDKLSFVPFLG